MAALVLAHDLAGAVGRAVVGDEDLEGEGRLLGEGAVERSPDPVDVVVGEDEDAHLWPRRAGHLAGNVIAERLLAAPRRDRRGAARQEAARVPSAKAAKTLTTLTSGSSCTFSVVWNPGASTSCSGKAPATSGRSTPIGARQIVSPPVSNSIALTRRPSAQRPADHGDRRGPAAARLRPERRGDRGAARSGAASSPRLAAPRASGPCRPPPPAAAARGPSTHSSCQATSACCVEITAQLRPTLDPFRRPAWDHDVTAASGVERAGRPARSRASPRAGPGPPGESPAARSPPVPRGAAGCGRGGR